MYPEPLGPARDFGQANSLSRRANTSSSSDFNPHEFCAPNRHNAVRTREPNPSSRTRIHHPQHKGLVESAKPFCLVIRRCCRHTWARVLPWVSLLHCLFHHHCLDDVQLSGSSGVAGGRPVTVRYGEIFCWRVGPLDERHIKWLVRFYSNMDTLLWTGTGLSWLGEGEVDVDADVMPMIIAFRIQRSCLVHTNDVYGEGAKCILGESNCSQSKISMTFPANPSSPDRSWVPPSKMTTLDPISIHSLLCSSSRETSPHHFPESPSSFKHSPSSTSLPRPKTSSASSEPASGDFGWYFGAWRETRSTLPTALTLAT